MPHPATHPSSSSSVSEADLRATWASELHDGPLQLLLVALQELSEIEAGPVALARQRVQEAVAELRSMLSAPPSSLPAALARKYLDDWAVAMATHRRFTWTLMVPFELGYVEHLAYGVLRELLTNAARHSGCSHLTASIGRHEGWTVIDCADDGVGLPADWRPGYGTHAMYARVTRCHVAGRDLGAGAHWDVQFRKRARLLNANEVWEVPRRSYLNVYPDGGIRAGSNDVPSAKRVWP